MHEMGLAHHIFHPKATALANCVLVELPVLVSSQIVKNY